MPPTPEMIEAADRAERDAYYAGKGRRERIEAALTAALSVKQTGTSAVLTMAPDICGVCGCTRVLRIDPLPPLPPPPEERKE